MIERPTTHFGRLAFDRDAIVRAALRAYVEAIFGHFPLQRVSFAVCCEANWTGDLQCGAFYNGNGEGDHVVVAWTEAGVVGLGYELGWGPAEQLGLSVDAVTGGPDDVRGAVPGLPEELEPALVLATSILGASGPHGERDAGVGFWLYGDRMGGTLFDKPTDLGADRLAMWGLLRSGRLQYCCDDKETALAVAEWARKEAPTHAIIDAVVDRRLRGPTELTRAELKTLRLPASMPEDLVYAQHMLQEVGITWPGSPELPPATPDTNPFTTKPFLRPEHGYLIRCFGPVQFNRDPIVRAALRAYVEVILAPLDPLARHVLTACIVPKWTGDLDRGAFFNGDGCGDYDVVAWTESGVVGLAYKRGATPIEQLGALLPGLPDELLPALEMAAGLLEVGAHGEKLASVGFWLHGDRTAGTLFDDPTLPGARRLVAWGALERLVPWGTLNENEKGRLPLLGDRKIAALAAALSRATASPIHAIVDAVTTRALAGPTELLPDELATLFPTLPDPDERLSAERMLQKVGITWPGSPESPAILLASPKVIARCHPLGYLAFNKEAIIRAALRAYIEAALAFLDPLERHKFKPAYFMPTWMGDLVRGGFSLDTQVAWTEAGVVGLNHEDRPGKPEWLPEGTVTRDPADVQRAVPDLPDALLPAFEMAFDLFNQRHSPRMKVEPVAFWLCGDRASGTLFDAPTARGVWRLATWGRIGRGRLLPAYRTEYATTITEDTYRAVAPLLAIVDAVTARALSGPTELLPDELATILPKPPLRPNDVPDARHRLQKVGITWPGG